MRMRRMQARVVAKDNLWHRAGGNAMTQQGCQCSPSTCGVSTAPTARIIKSIMAEKIPHNIKRVLNARKEIK